MVAIGSRIKEIRIKRGMSPEELAEKIGVSRSTMFRYENGGIEKVPGETLTGIAKALKTSPAVLMGWKGDVDDEPSTVAAHLDTDDLTEDELDDVANYIELVKKRRNK